MDKKYEYKISQMDDEELNIINSGAVEFDEEKKMNIENKFNKLIDKKESKIKKKFMKRFVPIACSLLLLVGGVNTNEAFAESLYSIPLVGQVARLLTIDRLTHNSENIDIDIEVARIEGLNDEKLEAEINNMLNDKSLKLYEKSIEESTDGREAIYQNYSVIRNDEKILVFELTTTRIKASAYESSRYYNIDIVRNKQVSLKDLFVDNSQYTTLIDNQIIKLMNSASENETYFIDEFKGIDKDTNFYINQDEKLVIVFDEYQVAPGYMGIVEFIIDTEVFDGIISDENYIS